MVRKGISYMIWRKGEFLLAGMYILRKKYFLSLNLIKMWMGPKNYLSKCLWLILQIEENNNETTTEGSEINGANQVHSGQATEGQQSMENKSQEFRSLEFGMQLELNANDTWDFVNLPEGKRALDSKWVYKIKYKPVERFKAIKIVI